MSRKNKTDPPASRDMGQDILVPPPMQSLQGDLVAVFEAMTDGVNVYDKNGTILHMNRAYRTLIGLGHTTNSYTARPPKNVGNNFNSVTSLATP